MSPRGLDQVVAPPSKGSGFFRHSQNLTRSVAAGNRRDAIIQGAKSIRFRILGNSLGRMKPNSDGYPPNFHRSGLWRISNS